MPVYRELFGYECVSGPFDDPVQKVSVCFLERGTAGDPVLELVAPLGEESPIQRTLSKGAGAYHICYETENLEQAIEHLTARGCLMVSPPVPAVAFNNRRIAWLYTSTRQLVELVER